MAIRRRGSKVAKRNDEFASPLEGQVGGQLERAGVPYRYECLKVTYTIPTYYPGDFLLDNGIIVETKGEFTTENRGHHKLIKEQHPDLDIRFVFGDEHNHLVGQKVNEFRRWWKSKFNTGLPRKIPRAIREEYDPAFYADTGLKRPSKTTYADWCVTHGFMYATGFIPQEWLDEPPHAARVAAANSFLKSDTPKGKK